MLTNSRKKRRDGEERKKGKKLKNGDAKRRYEITLEVCVCHFLCWDLKRNKWGRGGRGGTIKNVFILNQPHSIFSVHSWSTSCWFNPFTAAACKILVWNVHRRACKQYIFPSYNIYFYCYIYVIMKVLSHASEKKRKQKGLSASNLALLLVVFK